MADHGEASNPKLRRNMERSDALFIPILLMMDIHRAMFILKVLSYKDGVQRGSVMDMPVYPGDPLTPDIGATKDAKRLDQKDAKTIMKIPVLPISYEDALPLLQSLGGPVVLQDGGAAYLLPIMLGRVKTKCI